jgi:hypothetical protein
MFRHQLWDSDDACFFCFAALIYQCARQQNLKTCVHNVCADFCGENRHGLNALNEKSVRNAHLHMFVMAEYGP